MWSGQCLGLCSRFNVKGIAIMLKKNGFLWVDVAGLTLTDEDHYVLQHPKVSGVILFSKNFESVQQLRLLTQAILQVAPGTLIVTDHEGGRVQRFRDGFTELPGMSHWGSRYQACATEAVVELKETMASMVNELRSVGVYATLAPVLDIDYKRSEIIGARAFSDQPQIVAELGDVFIAALQANHMPAMAKHFPGHGYVVADSHVALPVDERALADIMANDIKPFAHVARQCDAVMPGHVVYQEADALPACFSSFWLKNVLREQLQFDGLIVSDDLTMQGAAIMGDYPSRARAALEAGCDILPVCNNREALLTILDQVEKPNCSDFERRLAHYARFMV